MNIEIVTKTKDGQNWPMIERTTKTGAKTTQLMGIGQFKAYYSLGAQAGKKKYAHYQRVMGKAGASVAIARVNQDEMILHAEKTFKSGKVQLTFAPKPKEYVAPQPRVSKLRQAEAENARLQAKIDKLLAKLGIEE